MDRFKFRAWHKKRKKFYDVLHLHLDSFNGIWATCKGFCITEHKDIHIQIQPKDCIIEQCTGLKDKNGKLIFEGDIVLCNNQHKGVVVFENNDCCFNVEGYYSSCDDYPTMAFIEGQPFEIIGTIHDED